MSFRADDEWLTYEPGGLHEDRPDMLSEINVIMPRLESHEGCSYIVAEIQKYRAKDGRHLWRSFDRYRKVFKDGYVSRERCAQDVVKLCPTIKEAIGWRQARLLREAKQREAATT